MKLSSLIRILFIGTTLLSVSGQGRGRDREVDAGQGRGEGQNRDREENGGRGQGRNRDREEENGGRGQGQNRDREEENGGRGQGRNRDREEENEEPDRGRDQVEDEGRGQGRDREEDDEGLDDDKCWTCEQSSGCFECLSKSDNADGTMTVEIDFSGCKNEANIGWACCTGSNGPDGVFQEGDCDVPDSGCFGTNNRGRNPDGSKCENVSAMFVVVPSDASSVVINTHDGLTGNDAVPAVGADPMCAGQEFQGGRCAKRNSGITSHCLETIDLSRCPSSLPLPSPAPTPSPSVVKVSTVAPTTRGTETNEVTPMPTTLIPTGMPVATTLSPTAATDTHTSTPSSVTVTTSSPTEASDIPSLVPRSDAPSDVPTSFPTSNNNNETLGEDEEDEDEEDN
ncbi:hypothetical protein FisN_27Lh097 [Fistulifera solaris]|uniref:Uncharacterized protein n=1 Tax=Fistulifera solaris TaxID=1519565 RepID=A0A1Z5KAM8_FISSO|nr:hypothetical protein FisN_27Lh097 [Fistulifera solaris]|eukprot:GAX23323.1 hypothetical protein FisN_27Lh097 [Fistulifera solaris]